jgi:hypothetical protein
MVIHSFLPCLNPGLTHAGQVVYTDPTSPASHSFALFVLVISEMGYYFFPQAGLDGNPVYASHSSWDNAHTTTPSFFC